MTPSQPVAMRFLQPLQTYVETSAWLVTPRGWLEKLCWRLLRRGKNTVVPYCRQDMVCTSVRIEPDQLARKVIEQAREHFKWHPGYGDRPKRVLIGPAKFSELMSDPTILQHIVPQMTIHGKVAMAPTTRFGRLQDFWVLGLEIEVVPHMEGILVL